MKSRKTIYHLPIITLSGFCRLPNGSSSLSQEESRSTNGTSNSSGTSVANGGITLEVLEKWKDELLAEVRQEINKAKIELLEAWRTELRLQKR